MLYLVGIIALASIAGIVWSFRKKLDKRTAERAKEFEALLSELKRNPLSSAGMAAGTTPPAAAVPAPTAVSDHGLGRKQRLLPQRGALLYFVFRTGMPDHEFFVNLTLADLVEIDPAVPGYEREQKARRLAQQRIDLVVCTNQLEVVAAVMVGSGENAAGAPANNADYIESCLQAAGIRILRIDPAALPRHHQVRELVYGVR